MPIYAYRCASCGHALDVLQKLSDPPLTQCPSCGQQTFVKQVTAAGFQLKGSGWYVTDFKGNGAKKPGEGAKTDGADGTKPGSGESAKTDSGESAKKIEQAKTGDGAKPGDAAPVKSADAGSSGSGSTGTSTSPKSTGGSAGC